MPNVSFDPLTFVRHWQEPRSLWGWMRTSGNSAAAQQEWHSGVRELKNYLRANAPELLVLVPTLDIEFLGRQCLQEYKTGNSEDSEGKFIQRLQSLEAALLTRPEGNAGTPADQTASAFRIGDCLYLVGESTIVLEESEDHVLRSLIDLGGAAKKQRLEDHSGKSDAPRILKTIRNKHPELEPHISLPGGRGKGGYRTTIRHAKPPRH